MERAKSKSTKYEPKKCIVQPKDDATMLNSNGETLHHHRPSVVTFTQFVEQKLSEGTINIFAKQLPAEANDEDFKEFVKSSEGDMPLAISAYCSQLGVDVDGKAIQTND